jgi:hypothetical protein
MKEDLYVRIKKQDLMDVLNAIRIGIGSDPIMKYGVDQMVKMTICKGDRSMVIKTIDLKAKIMITAVLVNEFFHQFDSFAETKQAPFNFGIYLEDLFEIARDAEEDVEINIPDERNGEMVIFRYGKNTNRFYGYQKIPEFPEHPRMHAEKQVVIDAKDVIERCKVREPLTVRVEKGETVFGSTPSCMCLQQYKGLSFVFPVEVIKKLYEDEEAAQLISFKIESTGISAIQSLNNIGNNVKTMEVNTVASQESVGKLIEQTCAQEYSVDDMDAASKGFAISSKVMFILNEKKGVRSLACHLSKNRGSIEYIFYNEMPKAKKNMMQFLEK